MITKEALNVCRLLAINPEDILKRDIKDLKEPGLSE
jgi:DNA-binding Xre family transcriptional regulator